MSFLTELVSSALLALISNKCHGEANIIDLSHDIHNNSAVWPSEKPFIITENKIIHNPQGDIIYEANRFCMSEHTGTHLDAPSHFAQGKWTVDQIPITHLIAQGVVIDIREKVLKDSTAELSPEDILAFVNTHGPLPDGVIILINTGWSSRYGDKKAYYGTDTNSTDNLIFPGISTEAAKVIANYKAEHGSRIFGVGLDSPSLDNGPSKQFLSHTILTKANIYGLENLVNLDELPTKDFKLTVMPMKIRGGSGGPARVVATWGRV